MFSSSYKSVAAYQQIGVETDVASADPHKLILLLFEGAQAAVALAKKSMAKEEIAQKGQAISKAIDIIENGLKASLNMDVDSDLPEKLNALYEYMVARLLQANLKNDEAALDEVAALLGEIHGAWIEIRDQVRQA